MKEKIVILGSGFGAISFVKAINLQLYSVTIVSPRNHFLFTPLLPSTTVGTVEFRSIIEPVRTARQGVEYIQATCTSIDPVDRTVSCVSVEGKAQFDLPYDTLIIAIGARNNTFGIPGVEEHALFLRELSDARAIREHIVASLEQADVPGLTKKERERRLTFVVVGGGPTGVEFAAELHDLLDDDLKRSYPHLVGETRIYLFEAGGSLLTSFDEDLRNYTLDHFKRSNIEVRLDTRVKRVTDQGLVLESDAVIPAGTIVWSTGNAPLPLIDRLPFSHDPSGRLVVDEYLRIPDFADIIAIGDCADVAGSRIPQTAQAAMQEGKYVAKRLNREGRGKAAKPFAFKNLGMLAYVGEGRALADIPRVHFSWKGFFTFVFWRSAYLTRLVSLKNKILVFMDWCKTSVFGRDLSRF